MFGSPRIRKSFEERRLRAYTVLAEEGMKEEALILERIKKSGQQIGVTVAYILALIGVVYTITYEIFLENAPLSILSFLTMIILLIAMIVASIPSVFGYTTKKWPTLYDYEEKTKNNIGNFIVNNMAYRIDYMNLCEARRYYYSELSKRRKKWVVFAFILLMLGFCTLVASMFLLSRSFSEGNMEMRKEIVNIEIEEYKAPSKMRKSSLTNWCSIPLVVYAHNLAGPKGDIPLGSILVKPEENTNMIETKEEGALPKPKNIAW